MNRIIRILGEKYANKLSPWGWFKENEVTLVGNRRHQVYELVGISSIDYMDAYKKFTYVNQESYSSQLLSYHSQLQPSDSVFSTALLSIAS